MTSTGSPTIHVLMEATYASREELPFQQPPVQGKPCNYFLTYKAALDEVRLLKSTHTSLPKSDVRDLGNKGIRRPTGFTFWDGQASQGFAWWIELDVEMCQHTDREGAIIAHIHLLTE